MGVLKCEIIFSTPIVCVSDFLVSYNASISFAANPVALVVCSLFIAAEFGGVELGELC